MGPKWKKDSRGSYFYHDKSGERVYLPLPPTHISSQKTSKTPQHINAEGAPRSQNYDEAGDESNVGQSVKGPSSQFGHLTVGDAIDDESNVAPTMFRGTSYGQEYDKIDKRHLETEAIEPHVLNTTHTGTEGSYAYIIAENYSPPTFGPEEENPVQPTINPLITDPRDSTIGGDLHGPEVDGVNTAHTPTKLRHISGTRGDSEKLDHSYQKRKKDYKTFFRVGKVFSTLWTELYDGPLSGQAQTFLSEIRYGGRVLSKIRRFVVVKEVNNNKCCTCLPVTSYQGKGPFKEQINVSEHGYIYSHQEPKPVGGITKRPLKVKLINSSAPLPDQSLVNYARVYTVEANVKVKEVGDLDPSSRTTLLANFRDSLLDYGEALGELPSKNLQMRNEELSGIGSGIVSNYTEGARYYHTASRYGGSVAPSNNASNTAYSYLPAVTTNNGHGYAQNPAPLNNMNQNFNPQVSGQHQQINASYRETAFAIVPSTNYDVDYGDQASSLASSYYPMAQNREDIDCHDNSRYHQANVNYASSAIPEAEGDFNLEPSPGPPPINRPRWRRERRESHTLTQIKVRDIGEIISDIIAETQQAPSLTPKTKSEVGVDSWLGALSIDNTVEDFANKLEQQQSDADRIMPHAVPMKYRDTAEPNNEHALYALAKSIHSRSSIDSVESVGSSKTSISSISAFGSETRNDERYAQVLLCDEELQALFEVAAEEVTIQRFRKNFRKCLLQFAVHLKAEAAAPEARAIASNVKKLSTSITNLVLRNLESKVAKYVPGAKPKIRNLDNNSESDSDESELEVLDEERAPNISGLESIILTSRSFRMLRENLRLFLCPDPVLKALFRVWPVTCSRKDQLRTIYNVESEISTFMANGFTPNQNLGDVMTLTGGPIKAQATSCRDYLATTWPRTGMLLLEGMEKMLSSGRAVMRDENATIELNTNERGSSSSSFRIVVIANHEIQREIISATCWLSACLRTSYNRGLSLSSTLVKCQVSSNAKPQINFRLGVLQEVNPSREGDDCWHRLFPYTVIANGFPIALRKGGKGLEISFADMALMSKSTDYTEYEGGIIVEGLRTLLVPVSELSEDDAIQWHLEDKLLLNGKRTARISNILSANKFINRHKQLNPELLFRRRAFLGWVEEAHVMIGTKRFSNVMPRWSGTPIVSPVRQIRSHNITIGTGGLGFVTATGSRIWIPTAVPASTLLEDDKDMHELLVENDEHITIYDSAAMIGWDLPQASVVLYLVSAFITRYQLQLFDGDKPIDMPHAPISSRGNSESARILKESLSFLVLKGYKPPLGKSWKEEKLLKIIERTWRYLDKVGTTLEKAMEEYLMIPEGAPRYLYGIELLDVMKRKAHAKIHRKKIEQPWVHFTNYQPTVLFCRECLQPIVPVFTQKLCKLWKSVPTGKNYFVAMVSHIQQLLERNNTDEEGTLLDERVEWVVENMIIQSHTYEKDLIVQHVQKLRSIDSRAGTNGLCRAISQIRSFSTGCLVFTDTKIRQNCSQGLDRSLWEDPQLTNHIIINKPLPDLPELSSDTSIDDDIPIAATLSNIDSVSSTKSSHYSFSSPFPAPKHNQKAFLVEEAEGCLSIKIPSQVPHRAKIGGTCSESAHSYKADNMLSYSGKFSKEEYLNTPRFVRKQQKENNLYLMSLKDGRRADLAHDYSGLDPP